MKKALVVFLILAVAGGMFAQSFSGRVGTGIVFAFDGEDNPVWAYEGTDWRHKAVWAEVNFDNGGDDWGIGIGTNAEVDKNATGTSGLNIDWFNGWVRFADIFTLKAGKGVGDEPWRFTDVWWDTMSDSVASSRLEIEPIPGLNFGFLFGYPKTGSNAKKIANFFQETGIGAKYDAGIFSVHTSFQLESEETTDGDPDATWRFGVKVPLNIVNVAFQANVGSLMSDRTTIKVGEKIWGNIVGLDWSLNTQQFLAAWSEKEGSEEWVKDDLKVDLEVGLSYGIPINDKASAKVGGSAKTVIIPEFVADNLKWNAYGKVSYDFNDKVSTSAELGLDNGKRADGFDVGTGKVTPYIFWKVGYSF